MSSVLLDAGAIAVNFRGLCVNCWHPRRTLIPLTPPTLRPGSESTRDGRRMNKNKDFGLAEILLLFQDGCLSFP